MFFCMYVWMYSVWGGSQGGVCGGFFYPQRGRIIRTGDCDGGRVVSASAAAAGEEKGKGKKEGRCSV